MSPEVPTMISRRWKRFAVGGNLVMAIAEAATGRLDNLPVLADSVHNLGDAMTYGQQSDNVLIHQHGEDAERLLSRRRFSHGVICAGSLAVAGVATSELIIGSEHYITNGSIGVAAASVVFNGLLAIRPMREALGKRKNKLKHSDSERDIVKHIAFVDMPSSLLALGGSLLQKYNINLEGINTEQIVAITSGIWGAWNFRPSTRNLNHDHQH